jgi:hypothetical protein
MPSMIISRLPKRITIKPHQTRACINPITGFRKILSWKKAICIVTARRFPKLCSGFFLVNLKYLKILEIVHENMPSVIKTAMMNKTCLSILSDLGL